MKRKLFVLFVLVILFLIIRLYIDDNVLVVEGYNIGVAQDLYVSSDSELYKDTFVQISDLHNKSFGDGNIDLINKINSLNPKCIFLTGDLVSADDTDFKGLEALLSGISSKYKCYYIIGNHEEGLKGKSKADFYDLLEKYGVMHLKNDRVYLYDNVALYGLEYSTSYYSYDELSLDDITELIGLPNEEDYNILITHNPDYFDLYAQWGADLVICGHTHGGMIRIFGNGLISPKRDLFPRFDGSTLYYNDEYDSCMIVSKGLSSGQRGFRLFNQPEVVEIKFNPK